MSVAALCDLVQEHALLTLENAMLYNSAETIFHQEAKKLKDAFVLGFGLHRHDDVIAECQTL